MKAKFIIHGIDTGYPNGGMTLTMSAIAAIGGTVVTRLEGGKRGSKSFKKREEEYSRVMGVPVEIATSDDEVRQMCEDIDVLFALPFGNKVWPTFESALQGLSCKKVAFLLGSAESRRAPMFTKSKIWDARWSERPMIRDYMQSRRIVDPSKPYVVGCNVYDLKCALSSEEVTALKDPRNVISSARFGSFKGSDQVLKVLNELIKDERNHLDAWGWTPNEAGMSFLGMIKGIPEMKAMWDDTGHKVARGTYNAPQIPDIMRKARFAIDFTRGNGDGSIFGDGGLQYCQAEAIDWGAIPVCDSDFHRGEGWNSVMLLTGRDDVESAVRILKEELETWDPEAHARKVEAGRQYIRDNLNRDRFNASMSEILEKLS